MSGPVDLVGLKERRLLTAIAHLAGIMQAALLAAAVCTTGGIAQVPSGAFCKIAKLKRFPVESLDSHSAASRQTWRMRRDVNSNVFEGMASRNFVGTFKRTPFSV